MQEIFKCVYIVSQLLESRAQHRTERNYLRIFRWYPVRADHPARNEDDDNRVGDNADTVNSDSYVKKSEIEHLFHSREQLETAMRFVIQIGGSSRRRWDAMFDTIMSSVTQQIVPSVIVALPFVERHVRNPNRGEAFNCGHQSRVREITETPAKVRRVVQVVDVNGVPPQ